MIKLPMFHNQMVKCSNIDVYHIPCFSSHFLEANDTMSHNLFLSFGANTSDMVYYEVETRMSNMRGDVLLASATHARYIT